VYPGREVEREEEEGQERGEIDLTSIASGELEQPPGWSASRWRLESWLLLLPRAPLCNRQSPGATRKLRGERGREERRRGGMLSWQLSRTHLSPHLSGA